jgi:hypothetical protein
MKTNRRMWQGKRFTVAVIAALLGALLICGCSPQGSGMSVHQLVNQYSWLAPLGYSVIQWLIQQFGPDLSALLSTAATLLLG